jgi:hypothetical protein
VRVTQHEEGSNLPEGPVRWSWKVCLTVTLNSAATILNEVSEYLVDVSELLIKDFEARRQDTVRLELESLEDSDS